MMVVYYTMVFVHLVALLIHFAEKWVVKESSEKMSPTQKAFNSLCRNSIKKRFYKCLTK